MPRLSVNLNKIALLRNARCTGVPDLSWFAILAKEAHANGLTIHPRPDERHIRRSDIFALEMLMRPWRPEFELNIEGYPDRGFLDLMAQIRPEQCTLVPDAPGALTSSEGWRLNAAQMPQIRASVEALHAAGCRVMLFVDPAPELMARALESGADGVEIYTGAYAAACREGSPDAALAACATTAKAAHGLGLVVNVGHDLNLSNLPPLVAALPQIAEASIGHELTADALLLGWTAAIGAYRVALRSD